jgi:hypothetical protein
VPTFRTHCDSCASLGGKGGPGQVVFADSGTARFVRRIAPFHFWLWFLVSPFGWATIWGVRWVVRHGAERLHNARATSGE